MKRIINKYIEYIVAFIALVVNVDDAIYVREDIPVKIIFYIIQLGLLLLMIKQNNRCFIINKLPYVWLLLFTFFIATVHCFNSLTYVYKIFLFVLCYYIVTNIHLNKFQIAFCNIMYFLSCFSLICYFLLNLCGIDLAFASFSNQGGEQYNTNYIFSYITYWPIRNCSIYREPGIFQIYLNVALIFYYNIHKNILFDRYIAVFVFSLITTLSPAGILFCGALVTLQMIQVQKIKLYQLAFFVVALVGIFYFVSNMYDTIFSKISAGTSENASASARLYSIIIPLKIFLENPVLGVGALEFNSIIENYTLGTGQTFTSNSISNTLTTNFATSGLFIGCLYVVYFCKGIAKICWNYKRKFPYILIAIGLLFCENITYSLLFNICLILGMVSSNKRQADKYPAF